MSVIDSTVLRVSATTLLQNANTIAGRDVYSPNDWPNTADTYPIIVVRTPHERKENASGRNGEPMFWSTVSMVVIGRVSADNEYDAYASVELLSTQIEKALLTNQKFVNDNGIAQFLSVETTREVKSASEVHIGECVVVLRCEVFQQFDTVIDAGGHLIGKLEEITITTKQGDETLAYQDFKFTP